MESIRPARAERIFEVGDYQSLRFPTQGGLSDLDDLKETQMALSTVCRHGAARCESGYPLARRAPRGCGGWPNA